MPPLARVIPVLLWTIVLAAGTADAQSCFNDRDCADATLCNGVDRCVATTCHAGVPLGCDDGDPCTLDSCDPAAGCAHQDDACPAICGPSDDGLRCSDGTACTTGDTCAGGACVGTALACDDADPCTTDDCDVVLGCVYVEEAHPPACVSDCGFIADHTPCPGDGDPCTQDGCLEGQCQVGLRQFVRQCEDSDRCNGDEFCSSVKGCEPDEPPVCDDGDLCSGTETCVPASGCQPGTPAPDGTDCDDGRVCTVADACNAGACTGATDPCDDADASTADVCTETTGCLHCTPMIKAKLSLTFPLAPRPGKFTLKGTFAPPAPLDPTTPAGADLVLHDGASAFHESHVAGAAFVVTGSAPTYKFLDKTGTLANGLQKLQLKTGSPTRPAKLSAKGVPASSSLGGDTTNSITLVAGPACSTATVPCTLVRGGNARRCQTPNP